MVPEGFSSTLKIMEIESEDNNVIFVVPKCWWAGGGGLGHLAA